MVEEAGGIGGYLEAGSDLLESTQCIKWVSMEGRYLG